MHIFILLLSISYWLLLTVLLLAQNPAGLVGLHHVPIFPWGKFGVHLLAFMGLGVLVNATRWPKRVCWQLIVFLSVYGIATESLQFFVQHRTSRAMDGIENILGVLAGSAIYWCMLRWVQPSLKHNLAVGLVKHPITADSSGK